MLDCLSISSQAWLLTCGISSLVYHVEKEIWKNFSLLIRGLEVVFLFLLVSLFFLQSPVCFSLLFAVNHMKNVLEEHLVFITRK